MYLYFGSDQLSRSILEGISDQEVPRAVVTQPDRRSGRKMQLRRGPLSDFAHERGIDLVQPETLKDQEVQRQLLDFGADRMIVVSFGQILPKSFIDASPPIINVHTSLLPKYRGASPIQSALLNGDEVTGVAIMHIVPALDAGPVIAMQEVAITEEDDHATLSAKLIEESVKLLKPFLNEEIPAGEEQDHGATTHCGKLTKEDCRLNPCNQEKAEARSTVRAFAPKPGAFVELEKGNKRMRFKLLKVGFSDLVMTQGVFEIRDSRLFLGFSDGALELFEVQIEGKAAMKAADFLNGWGDELNLAL